MSTASDQKRFTDVVTAWERFRAWINSDVVYSQENMQGATDAIRQIRSIPR